METLAHNLHNRFQSLRAHVDVLNESIEPQFLQMVVNFEDCRRKWLQADEELGACREVLSKAQTETGALEVKLKHARNQVDVEIRRRQKAEADYEKLERQIQLIRDLLISENSSSSVHLSEEQRSALAFLNAHSQAAQAAKANTSHRLTTIDESASMLSDISYDKTDDSLDWDSSVMRTVRLRKRQKRRSSRNHADSGLPQTVKKPRSSGRPSERSLVAKTTITVPANGGPVEAVSTIQTLPYWTQSRRPTAIQDWETTTTTTATTDQSENVTEAPVTPVREAPPPPKPARANGGARKHEFIAKTVIKSEFCVPCGRKTKFGKLYLRCVGCRAVAHPECRDRCPLPCNPSMGGALIRTVEATLADYAPTASPMIPALVVHCVKEIEHRGMHEAGLYRLSGAERTVKELKERFLRTKTVPPLCKVEDINAVTGLLKDFLRKLPEPLLTFRLNRTFMEAAEIQDDDNSLAVIYQTVSELPQPNRDTLAFMMIHLQRVAQCVVDTKMDVTNLARVFGPTLVGHAVPDPDPMTILQDTNRQPRVIERLLSLSVEYWSQFTAGQPHPDNMDHADCYNTPDQKVSMLGPVTTPEHQMSKTPSSSSLSQRMKQTLSSTTIFGSRSSKPSSNSRCQVGFFASPQLK